MKTLKHAPARALGLLILLTAVVACEAQEPRPPVRPPEGFLEGLADGHTEIIDMTHPLNPESPHWPGEGYDPFSYEVFQTLDEDGVLSAKFAMAEHTGTHVDAPNHFVEGQLPLDRIPPSQLIVRAVVIDAREQVAADPDYRLTVEDVTRWEEANGTIPANTFVFMYTGWDERWSDFDAYKNADEEGRLHFPGYTGEAAELLVNERDVAGMGIDTLSVDYGLSEDFEVHLISNRRDKYHVENAANLGSLPATGAWLIVAPIKIENGTGGPARVFALVREDTGRGGIAH